MTGSSRSRALEAASVLAGLLFAPMAAAGESREAGDATEAPVALAPIEVAAAALEAPAAAENPSRFVEVVDAEPVRERVESAADLVEDVAGVRVRRYGGLGSFATVSLRGSAPSQVPVFVDGVPAGDAHSGLANLETLATADLARIEIYRGFAPAALGEAGIGGAVNLVTRAAPRDGGPEVSAGMSGGSFGTWRAWASGAGALGDGPPGRRPGLRVTFGWQRTRGDYRFRSDHGTPDEPADDETLLRRNNDSAQTTASARLAAPLGNWDLDGALAFVRTDQGLPGLDYDQARAARLEGTDLRLRLAIAAPDLLRGRLAVEVGAYGVWRADRFADPLGEIGVGRQIEEDLGGGGGAWGMVAAFLGDGAHVVRARVETSGEAFRPSYELPESGEGPLQRRWLLRVLAGYEASVLDDALVLLADVRVDAHVDDYAGDPRSPLPGASAAAEARDVLVSPSGGLRWRIAEGLEARANGGWFHRVPTFAELFGDRGAVVGNPGLLPESAANADAGLVWTVGGAADGPRLTLEAAFFGSFAENLIVFVPQSQSVFRAENIGASRTLGVEATLRAAWGALATLDARYTFLDARDTSDAPYWSGNRLPGRAPHDLALRCALGRWGAELWYEADFTAETPLDRANLRTVPARLLHAAGLTYRLRRPGLELSATVEGRNLGDTWAYDAFRYPLPGRAFFATFAVRM